MNVLIIRFIFLNIVPPSKTKQLSRKLRSSRKLKCGKKQIIFKEKQKPSAKKFKKLRSIEKGGAKFEIKIKEECPDIDDAQVQPNNEGALSVMVAEPGIFTQILFILDKITFMYAYICCTL